MGNTSVMKGSVMAMLEDLERALKKPRDRRLWGMVIDLRKCTGCNTCTVACIAEYKLPPGVVYRPVMEMEYGEYPNVVREFIPRPCMHCENPPCLRTCPVGATYKRDDGVVVIDYNRCIGCRSCIVNCPYGARTFDKGDYYTADTTGLQPYETAKIFEMNRAFQRKGTHRSPIGNARKCHFCTNRVESGLLPLCVTSCLGRATYFGDTKDPDALVSKIKRGRTVMVLKRELGTNPKVLYIV
jgi:tetrathionate reductase subunit B